MKIGVVDYGMGNLTSVINALQFLEMDVDLIDDPDQFCEFDKFILPGVGAFGKAMCRLNETGLDEAILEAASQNKRIVGICLGMQLLFSKSYEFGEHDGLDLIKGEVIPFRERTDLRVPHMGWNTIESKSDEFASFNDDYYFVHSFYCVPENKKNVLFQTSHGIDFCSGAYVNGNIFGLQFHPEKSQKKGLELLSTLLG